MAFAAANLQQDSSHWSEVYPFSEPLPIDFPAQYSHLNEPDQSAFCAGATERFAANCYPIVLAAELSATSNSVFELVI